MVLILARISQDRNTGDLEFELMIKPPEGVVTKDEVKMTIRAIGMFNKIAVDTINDGADGFNKSCYGTCIPTCLAESAKHYNIDLPTE